MEEKLIQRLESAVSRLEALSTGFRAGATPGDGGDVDDAASDPSIVAFGDLMDQYLGRVSSAAEKIGGQVLEVTNIVHEAFAVQKQLLIQVKQSQVSSFTTSQVIDFYFCLFFHFPDLIIRIS